MLHFMRSSGADSLVNPKTQRKPTRRTKRRKTVIAEFPMDSWTDRCMEWRIGWGWEEKRKSATDLFFLTPFFSLWNYYFYTIDSLQNETI